MKPKLLAIAAANNFHFLDDILKALENDFDINTLGINQKVSLASVHSAINNTDCVWLEWLDGYCLELLTHEFTKKKHLRKKKVVLRIHRYELFNDRLLNSIQFVEPDLIDRLVFVSEYVKQIGISHFPWMEKGVVIPNLIDVDKFPFVKREKGYDLLFLGRISYVKNLPFMLDMFNELLKLDSRYHLHLVGNISDKELYYYLDNYMKKMKIYDKIFIHGHVLNDELPSTMAMMQYVCCSSIFESQGVGILEAMASGLKPVIFNFPGAETFFPEKWLYMDRKDFTFNVMSPDYDSQEYRDFVLDNYSIQKKIGLYRDLIQEVLK